MLKNRKLLISGGVVTGIMTLNCFCCLIFRTRFPASAFVNPAAITAVVDLLALPALH
jgi:hypothetical protein